MPLTRRHLLTALIAAPFAGAALRAEENGELLTKEQEARLKKYLPKTFARLRLRLPVFVAVCGDEISAFFQPGVTPTRSSHLMAWYGRFLDRLGASFYYHSGVVDLSPVSEAAAAELRKQWAEFRKLRVEWDKTKKGDQPKIPGLPDPDSGGPFAALNVNDMFRLTQLPEEKLLSDGTFYADNYASYGAVGVQVYDPLLSTVFRVEEKGAIDLVILGYGTRDALEGTSLATFRTVMEAAIAECRSKGADVILAGPPPALDEADERSAIGRARPWAAVMREVAEANGVFFADLGQASIYQPSDLLNRTVQSTFRASIEPVRRMFEHGAKIQDGLHPNATAHLRMGEVAADCLLNGEPARPFKVCGPKGTLHPQLNLGAGPNGEDVLTICVASLANEPLTIGLSPLRFAGWLVKPGTPDRVHTFQPGRGARLFKFVMLRSTEPLPGHEEFIRGSVMISDDDAQHLVDVKVQVRPLAMLWPEQRTDGAAGDCLLKCMLVNTGDEDLDVALTLDWQGKQTPLPGVKISQGDRQALAVRLPLPPVESAFRFKDVVTVIGTANGRTWKWTRRVEGVRHAGLKQKLPLVPMALWRSKASVPATDASVAGAHVTVDADASGIFFQVDVPPETVSDVLEGKPWGRLEIQMDGRKTGENGTLGCVGSLIMEIPRQDGNGRLLPVRPAVFGNGYALTYPPGGFLTPVTVRRDGSWRIQFNMRRNYLKYHEWSLDGSGQSELGINVRLYLCDAGTGGYSEAKTYILTASSFPAADARSLTLLELRGTPAARWSLRIG